MPFNELRNQYISDLRVLFSSERQIAAMLPILARAAYSDELRLDFEQQLERSQQHIRRLQRIFEALNVDQASRISEAVWKLIGEIGEVLKANDVSSIRDSTLVVVARRLKQQQIAAYTASLEQAGRLGECRALALLQQTLIEQTEAERTLSWLGEKLRISHEWFACASDEHNVV